MKSLQPNPLQTMMKNGGLIFEAGPVGSYCLLCHTKVDHAIFRVEPISASGASLRTDLSRYKMEEYPRLRIEY